MIQNNVSLLPYNTFGIDVKAKKFAPFTSLEELKTLLSETKGEKLLILGGGSNILFTQDFDGIVLKNEMKNVTLLSEDDNTVKVEVGGGEVWHEFVLKCIENNWAGVENMSLIPGTVGAAPIQNIGAYGVELKDVFQELTALNLETLELEKFVHPDCEFGYRDSVFKRHLKGKYVIVSVVFCLDAIPEFKVGYGIIQRVLQERGVKELSIKAVSDAVVSIRESKLPNPKEIGNGGSFFKNPEIPTIQFEALKDKFPDVVGYKVSDIVTKVPAGWLIDKAGWKGKVIGDIGVHENQALVLVNYGKGKGQDIYNLAMDIKKSVKDIYGVEIEPEVNLI